MQMLILIALFGAFTVNLSSAFAGSCEIKTVDGYVQITKGPGPSKNSPNLKELFDAFNNNAAFFKDANDGDGYLSPVYLNLINAEGEPIPINFKTFPKKGSNDGGVCRKKNQTPISAYDCRVEKLAKNPKLGGLTEGLDTRVIIEIPENETDLLSRITNAIGCDEMLEANVRDKMPGSAPSTRGNGNSQPVPQLAPVKK